MRARAGRPEADDASAELARRIQEILANYDAGLNPDLTFATTAMDLLELDDMLAMPVDVLRQPLANYGMWLDDEWVSEPSLSHFNKLRAQRGFYLSTEALGYLLTAGSFDGTTAELATLLTQVGQHLNTMAQNGPTDDSVAGRIAALQRFDLPEQQALAPLFHVTEMPGVTATQCQAIDAFHQLHPAFFPGLLDNGLVNSFVFGDRKAASLGGGEFRSATRQLAMGNLPAKAPTAFLRLFLHETGHAGFQRKLLNGAELNGLDTGEFLPAFEFLYGAFLGNNPPAVARPGLTRPKYSALPVALSNELTRSTGFYNRDRQDFAALPPDAKALYQCWAALRQNGGQYMIGVDLGTSPKKLAGLLDGAQRQGYQAGNFSEFLAESFMHLAMGDLDVHVDYVLGSPTHPDHIKNVWARARQLIHAYGDPVLNGQP
jgi:hypothetical protein